MRKVIVNEFLALDGTAQAPGGADEDTSGGFRHGGWHMRHGSGAGVAKLIAESGGFLLGRRTYELFAGYWGGVRRDDVDDPFVSSLNSRPKFVASNTITDPQWADTTVLSGDLEAAIRELKAKPGGELQVHGSGRLIRWLLEHELVDEMTLIVCPVIVGAGTRLFPETGKDFALELVESLRFPTGILAQTYRPNGRPEYA